MTKDYGLNLDKINTATSRETGAKKPDPKNLGLGMNNHLTQDKEEKEKEAKIEKKGEPGDDSGFG